MICLDEDCNFEDKRWFHCIMSPNWLSLFEKSEGQSGSSQAFLFKPPFLVYISNSSSITKTEIYHPAPVSQADFFISQVSDVRCSNCRARQPMPSNICQTQFSWRSSKCSDLKVNYRGFCILHFALPHWISFIGPQYTMAPFFGSGCL